DSVLAQLTGWITSARNLGPAIWQGQGLTSSIAASDAKKITGLAILLNDRGDGTPIQSSFKGHPLDVNSILVRYTYNGDLDLSGKVDSADYFLLDSGFLSGRAGYQNGDVDYNGKINGADYFLIDSAFLGQTGILSGDHIASVPEPGALSILASTSA